MPIPQMLRTMQDALHVSGMLRTLALSTNDHLIISGEGGGLSLVYFACYIGKTSVHAACDFSDFGKRCRFVLQQVFKCLATERSRVQVIGGSHALKVSVTGGSVRYRFRDIDSECECGSLCSGVCDRVLSACASSSSLGPQLHLLGRFKI